MCGIVGVVRADGAPVAPAVIVAMRDRLAHRGPDDAGLHVAGPVGLGARRLAVIDLTPAGHQPMVSHDGNLWIVFNGEIYNHVELAEDLRAAGDHFVGRSDTEVLLHLYQRFGKECLRRLNGMFAFAIWDQRERTLFAARDRLGIKPFFYQYTSTHLAFASEVKALLASTASPGEPDRRAIADYLFCGGALGEKTGFVGLSQLEPGHSLTWRAGKLAVERYWDIAYAYEDPRREADLLAELAWLVDDSVRMQSRSDAPLGSHLSGGLDSSAIAGHAVRYVQPLKTFSIRFEDDAYYDESEHARAVAKHIGATHLEDVPCSRELVGLLPTLIYHMDFGLPVHGAFGYIAVSRLAKRHVKVSLTGHGGDELFAGYPKHFGATFGSTDGFDLPIPRAHGLSPMQRLRIAFRRDGVGGLARRLGRRIRWPSQSFEDRWVAAHCSGDLADHPMLHPRFVQTLGGYSPRESYLRPLREAKTDQPLDQALYHDLRVYLQDLLAMEDRLSMAVSLESRVPLLDHRIVELVARIPPALKVTGREPKRLLRDVARPLLPASVLARRDKRPFPIPVEKWFGDQLFSGAQAVLKSPRCLDRGVFHPDRLRTETLTPGLAWSLINVELWYRIFVDRDPQWIEQTRSLTTAPIDRSR
jgi:asparagine synthase (glutamine-hydrolysing)